MAQGEAVLRDLAAHPATARHSSPPSSRATSSPTSRRRRRSARIARAFRDSDGHLPTVYGALLDCPEAWERPLAKLKSPIEYVVSCAARAARRARGAKPQALYGALRGHGPAAVLRPVAAGLARHGAAWAGADALWKRIEWAGILAARMGSRVDPLRARARELRRGAGRAHAAGDRARGKPPAGPRAVARQPGIPAEVSMTTRREALQLLGGTAALAGLPRPGVRARRRGDERRLVFVFLRGGMDGLSAVPPVRRSALRGAARRARRRRAGHAGRRARSRRPLRPEPASCRDAQALCGARARGAARRRLALPRALAFRRAEPARERHGAGRSAARPAG